MKDSTQTTKFCLYQSQKENRRGENMKRLPSTSSHHRSIQSTSQHSSTQSRYSQKLQQKYSTLYKLYESSQTQIKSLQDQNNCLKKICQKQQRKISENKTVSMIRQQFNIQIQHMNLQKEKFSEILANVTEEHKRQMVQLSRHSQQTEAALQKQRYQRIKLEQTNKENILLFQIEIQKLKSQLDQKRNLEKKYKMLLKDLDRMQRSVSRTKQK